MVMKLSLSWYQILREEIEKPYIKDLKKFLAEEKARGEIIYPPEDKVFQAFSKTPYEKVKVVIMGQDPYHGPNQAHGLSFSVMPHVPIPPSLKNIFKEIVSDVKIPYPLHGCLEKWAEQGVLMLNATLTVRARQPKSHYGKGWEVFTDKVIEKLAEKQDPLIFVLWGASAREKCERILNQKKHKHIVLTSAHPSPFSAVNFFGCRHFSKINFYLSKWGKKPIDWHL
ncbi:MAG: uracil-DNA glycosylase [Simkaniaceae bacterium]